VFGVDGEAQDVPLPDSHVLEQLPRAVRRPCGLLAPQLERKFFQRSARADVGLLFGEQVDEVLAELGVSGGHESIVRPKMVEPRRHGGAEKKLFELENPSNFLDNIQIE
jgi:hypothetical protein